MSENKPFVGDGQSVGFEALQQDTLRDLAASLDAMQEAIRNHNEMERAQIPEDIFRRAYLPFFAGIPKEYCPMPEIGFNEWYGVSGGPNNAVDVVDPYGKVLFTVPPLNVTSVRNLAPNAKDHMYGNVLNRARELGDSRPQESQLLWRNELQRLGGTENHTARENAMLQWAPIFGYYGFLKSVKPTLDVASYYRELMGNTTSNTTVEEEATLEDFMSWE